eukprot:CAMPEP_0167741812 /NCGR_PEP_ID=MMETSP0110_2-20121227/1068_1 /TAXON_ID=629695 /ORGANISM="Gymnochlora sp., Strain CCMP2014" /LENGTH=650 /DNA_ID=CAMNT_0007625913 /DNA_START=585 /DNA_END=2534 /DNA_ORIENTATION=-
MNFAGREGDSNLDPRVQSDGVRTKVVIDEVEATRLHEKVQLEAKGDGLEANRRVQTIDLSDFLDEKKNTDGKSGEEYQVRGRTRLEIILTVLQKLVDELLLVCELVVPCFPPDYHIFHFFVSRYNAFINHTLAQNTLRSKGPKTPRSVLLKGLKWVNWYTDQLDRLFQVHGRYYAGSSEDRVEDLMKSWKGVRMALLDDWVSQLQGRLKDIVLRIAERGPDSEIISFRQRSSTVGRREENLRRVEVTTHNPVDLFSTLYAIIGPPLAPPTLGGFACLRLTEVVLNGIETYQAEQRKWINAAVVGLDQVIHVNKKKISDDALLAVLNDSRRHQRQADKLLRRRLLAMANSKVDAATPANLKTVARRCEVCTKQFALDAYPASKILEGTIVCSLLASIYSLAQQILSSSKKPVELKDEQKRSRTLKTLTATLNDFFSDWGNKLHAMVFARLLRDTVRSVACEYLRAIVRLAKSKPRPKEVASRIGKLVQHDLKELGTFIIDTSKNFPDIYLPKSVENADLLPLLLISHVMEAPDLETLQKLKSMFQRTLRMLNESESVMRIIDVSKSAKTTPDTAIIEDVAIVRDIRRRATAAKRKETTAPTPFPNYKALFSMEIKADEDDDNQPFEASEKQLEVINSLLKLRQGFRKKERR